MDTFVLNAIARELQSQICSSRINVIRQPDAYTLILELWQAGTSLSLAISVAPQHQYIFFSADPPKDQGFAPGKFFQHHLKGAEIRSIHTPLLERTMTFDIVKKDIDGRLIHFQLVLELMGRHSNVILLACDTRKVLESLRHVTAAQSAYRRIAPGVPYMPPPEQQKLDPTTLTQDQFYHLHQNYVHIVESAHQKAPPFWKYLVQQLQGISPVLAKDLAGAADSRESQWHLFSEMIASITSATYQPHILFSPSDQEHRLPIGVSALPLHCTPCEPAASMLQAIERYYHAFIEHQEIQTLRGSLLSLVQARLSKLQKKRKHLQEQQNQIERADEYKQRGDLLTANLYQLHKGMREANVLDYYTEGQPYITIPLNPKLTPAQNAQRYFRRYSKLKQGKAITQQRLHETKQAITYLEEWVFFIESADTLPQLHVLRQELEDVFEVSKQSRRSLQKSSKTGRSQPFLRFVSSDGFDIYVGRSSKENDLLTQRTARSDDIWLHVHQAPGSHVLILHRDPNISVSDQTIQEAAALAAYHSKLQHAGKVEVMYTSKKYVKKPKGAPPGLVTVRQYQTIRVTPQAIIGSANPNHPAKK